MPVDAAKLKEIKELFDSGVLTQEEYDAEKKKILDAPAPKAVPTAQPVAAVPQGRPVAQPVTAVPQGMTTTSVITSNQPPSGIYRGMVTIRSCDPPKPCEEQWMILVRPDQNMDCLVKSKWTPKGGKASGKWNKAGFFEGKVKHFGGEKSKFKGNFMFTGTTWKLMLSLKGDCHEGEAELVLDQTKTDIKYVKDGEVECAEACECACMVVACLIAPEVMMWAEEQMAEAEFLNAIGMGSEISAETILAGAAAGGLGVAAVETVADALEPQATNPLDKV